MQKLKTKKKGAAFSLLISFLAIPFCAQAQNIDLQYLTESAGYYHKVDPLLLRAVIYTESREQHFSKDGKVTTSRAGAKGLTQLMPGTAWEMQVDPLDPWANVYGGAKYLRLMLDHYNNNLPLALAAYNAGPGRVKDRVPDIAETQNYVAAVLYYYDWFKKTAPTRPASPAAVAVKSADPVFWVDRY